MLDESFLMLHFIQKYAWACMCVQCKHRSKQKVVVISCTKVQFKTGLADCGHSRLQFSSVRSYCNMFCFAGPLLGLPIVSTVWKDRVMIITSESMEVTWTVSVSFQWCWHWFTLFFLFFWYSWYLLVAAWRGNVKISFTQLNVVWLER